jgi:hypothetical protein
MKLTELVLIKYGGVRLNEYSRNDFNAAKALVRSGLYLDASL